MKLKKLVLAGFKSFADKTEFEFDDGISCIVGPNGCGKSNIVDAVKWVLGEQSAKSLRGSEMMDVIFNGSSTRKALGVAEVTLIFDDSSGLLKPDIASDGPANGEVSVTRRLFRDGQSEYLINKTPSRLRDIREMFMDTGVGVDAYSLIEQGKVEAFLQASQDDRRAIFDEAAGISKYKARKKEALRKLERVEQNLLRLNDVLGEVDKRLRSIKYQAGKARSYQAYSERLNELKSLYYLAQYHTLSAQRKQLQAALDATSDALAHMAEMIEQLESAQSGTEVELADLERTSREIQARIAAAGGQIAACQQRADMLASRVEELGDQIVAGAARCEELEAKIAGFDQQCQQRRAESQELESQSAQMADRLEALRQQHNSGELEITRLAADLEDEKAGTIDLFRRTSQLHNEIHGLGIRQESLNGQKSRLASRSDEIAETLKVKYADRSRIQEKLTDIQEVLEASQAKLDETRQASQHAVEAEQSVQTELSAAREKRSAVESRIGALREMQARLEGVSAGVRRVLEARRDGRVAAVRGMLGDFLQSDTRHAAVVEAALAGADQYLIAANFDQLQASANEMAEILGKNSAVEVLCLDRLGAMRMDLDVSKSSRGQDACTTKEIIGRVIDWVRFEPSLAPAMWRLLGKTLVVENLQAAAAAAESVRAGFRFVTLTGEVLEADGRVRIGSANRSSGVIARRSELAELEVQLQQLQQRIADLQQRCELARNEREHLEKLQQQLRTAIYEANTERVECDSKLGQVGQEIETLQREGPLIAEDLKHLSHEIEAAVHAQHQAKEKAAELEQLNAERQREIERLDGLIAAARQKQSELAGQVTELKVAQAAAEQKKLALKEALAAMARQREQMQQDFSAGRSQIELDRQRRADCVAGVEKAKEEAARLAAEGAKLEAEARDLEQSRRGLQEKLQEVRRQLAEQRKSQEQATAEASARRVELGEADVRIENLIARASEEMHMNLIEQMPGYRHDEQRDWNAVNSEIADLRGKIERLGNVNLDAIPEQDELEKQRQFMDAQMADIRKSQEQLAELIRRINKESRELFVRTFEVVRNNFHELFRKLFGGGKADIILTNPEDVLDSGIEIIARPPGKETRSLSLLSGGEKTMTALALLFSIFKSRPSPFCLLDEVDAALDEANNQRFNRLVGEFVSASQFIVITHSKRTMSMSNVLYGLTMQEPGVSKRIAVRFDGAGKKSGEPLQAASA